MRTIETHAVNGLNEALLLDVLDEPGQGGACHQYRVSWTPDGDAPAATCDIHFQNGPIKEHGVNGISVEVLLAIVRDRLECFQKGPFACETNQHALVQVIGAMSALQSRTRERLDRGVEGTNVV